MCVSLCLRTFVSSVWLVWGTNKLLDKCCAFFHTNSGACPTSPREPQEPLEVTCSGSPPVLSSYPSPLHVACYCFGAFTVGLPGKLHACSSVLIFLEELSSRQGLCGSSSISPASGSCIITVQSSTWFLPGFPGDHPGNLLEPKCVSTRTVRQKLP